MKESPKEKERTESVFFYLTKEDKIQFDAAKDNYDLQLSIINKYFESEKNWIKTEMQQIDDNLLQYRALLLKTREQIKLASEEHNRKLDEFWSEISKNLPNFKDKVTNITKELTPIVDMIKQINESIKNTSVYNLENLQKLANSFSNMTNKEKEFFMILFEHSKKEKEL